MNLFIIEVSPDKVAKSLDDSRCLNQAKEIIQMMSTSLFVAYNAKVLRSSERVDEPIFNPEVFWLPTHENHPVTRWISDSKQAWEFAYKVAVYCVAEHYNRFGTYSVTFSNALRQIKYIIERHGGTTAPAFIREDHASTWPLCVEERIRCAFLKIPYEAVGDTPRVINDFSCSVKAYRYYYSKFKNPSRYTNRLRPQWLTNPELMGDLDNTTIPF